MSEKTSENGSATSTLTDRIERIERRDQLALVQAARDKISRGESITAAEKKAVNSFDDEQLQKWGMRYCEGAPKKTYLAQIGISSKVAIDQSNRFNLIYHTSGATLNLFKQLRAWHRWASENKFAINKIFMSNKLEEELEEGEESLEFWQRELVRERTLRERDNRAEREKNMLPRQLIHDFLQEFYVEPMIRRIELLDRREGSMSPGEVSDLLRDDIQHFKEGVETLFFEELTVEDDSNTDSKADEEIDKTVAEEVKAESKSDLAAIRKEVRKAKAKKADSKTDSKNNASNNTKKTNGTSKKA